MTVAALYIDTRGPYPKLLGPELCWDESRDARFYDGPWPVVAHPPCGPWGRLRHLYRGNEHDCAPRAIEQVRAFGGVLEHPAGSRLWPAGVEARTRGGYVYIGVPFPNDEADPWGGFTIEVNQVEWGHVARKPTWLYIVGVPGEMVDLLVARRPFPGREPTHWISGGRGREGKKRKTTPVPPGIKVCSAQQRRRTPVAFAEFLITLAEQANRRAAEVT